MPTRWQKWRNPDRLPRPLVVWSWVVQVVFVVQVLAGCFVPLNRFHPGNWLSWSVFLPFTPVVVMVPLLVAARLRLRRLFDESGGRLCTWCAQSLKGLPDAGVCPECGRAYELVRDREAWRRGGLDVGRRY